MKWPPVWMTIRFQNRVKDDSHDFSLWLPLFIIGPIAVILVLALTLIALPFLLFSLLFTLEAWSWVWFGITAFFTTMQSLSGLKIEVNNRNQLVEINII